MKTVQIDSLDGLKIAGFTITVKLPNGEVQTIENGVTLLLKGELSLVDSGGKPISTADVLANVNLSAGASVIIPELINSSQKISEAEKDVQLQMAKAEQEQLEKRLEDLKKLKEDLEKKQKELEEKNKNKGEDEKSEEELKQQQEQSEQLQQLVDELNATLTEQMAKDIAGEQAVQAALQQVQKMQQELSSAESASSKKGKYNEAPSSNSKSGSSTAAPPEEQEDKNDLFVEVSLAASSDSGEKKDFITKHTKPTFDVETAAGAKITLILNGVEYEAVADSSGKAIIQTSEELPDGEYSITVKVVDSAGNEATTVKPLVIDTTPPEAEFKLESDSGTNTEDGITNVNKPTFTGKVSGDPVELYIKIGSQSYPLEAKNGEFSFTLPTKLLDGKYEVSLIAVDVAGNELIVKQAITIDTENSFDVSLQGSSDSGGKGDWLTNVTKPFFVFEHEPGAKIQIVINGVVHEVPSQNSNSTIFQLPVDLAEGINSVKFICVDVAGNRSVVEQEIVIDTKAPSFEFIGLTTDSNSGATSDNITANNQPSFQGKAEPGSTVYLVIDNITYSVEVGSNGRWSL
ncbi:MAG: Ig-like domain-containing protein, partial [Enterovibrio sp.]